MGAGIALHKFMLRDEIAQIGASWSSVFAAGLAFAFLGLLAFSWPAGSTVGLTFALGVVLVASGIIQGVHAFQLRKFTGSGMRYFQAISSLVAGSVILRYPGAGMIGIAIALSMYFFVNGSTQWMVASAIRPNRGWGWAFVGAVASFLLGVFTLATLPVSALWLPGTLLGLDLVFTGVSLIGFSFVIRDINKHYKRAIKPPSETKRAA